MAEDTLGVFEQPSGAGVRDLLGQNRPGEGFAQYVIPRSQRKVSGVYYAQTGAHLVLAAADAATAGRWFLVNQLSSGVLVALRRLAFRSQLGSALVAATSPRLQLERFTFTGTATGPQVTLGQRATSDPAATNKVRTSNAGMTVTAGPALHTFLPVASATAVAYNHPAESEWKPDEDEQPVLAPGEGLLFRQADAGTAADTRRYVTNLVFEEFTIP